MFPGPSDIAELSKSDVWIPAEVEAGQMYPISSEMPAAQEILGITDGTGLD